MIKKFFIIFPLLKKITAMLHKYNIYHSHLVCLIILLWSNLAHFEDNSKTLFLII
jgi:hypothetical protein